MKKIIYSFLSLLFISLVLYSGISIVRAQTTKNNFQFPIVELGNCKNETACKTYCDNPDNMSACIDFSVSKGLVSASEGTIGKKAIAKIQRGETPGGCKSKDECEAFCQNNTQDLEQCISFAEDIGVPSEEIAQAKQIALALKKGAQLPGGCNGKESCENYCKNAKHIDECLAFAEIAQIIPANELVEAKKIAPFLKNGETPGKCQGKHECETYCKDDSHFEECLNFAEKAQLIPQEDIDIARKTGGKGPGGCKSKDECEAYCNLEENVKLCQDFAVEKHLISDEEEKMMEGGAGRIKEGLEKIPLEMRAEVEVCLNGIFNGGLSRVIGGEKTITKAQGERIGNCFEDASKNYATQQGKPRGPQMQPPSKETIEKMMKGAPDSVKEDIKNQIEQKYKEGFEKQTSKDIPIGAIPNTGGIQRAPCNSEAECRAMFGDSPPQEIPQ